MCSKALATGRALARHSPAALASVYRTLGLASSEDPPLSALQPSMLSPFSREQPARVPPLCLLHAALSRRAARAVDNGCVRCRRSDDRKQKGWLHVQDEDSPAHVLWHALLAATLELRARAPGHRRASSDGPLDALADLVFVGEVFVQLCFRHDGESSESPTTWRSRTATSTRGGSTHSVGAATLSSYIAARARHGRRCRRAAGASRPCRHYAAPPRVRDVAVAVELVELATVLPTRRS